MGLLQTFLLSVIAFMAFKFLAPMVLQALGGVVDMVGNVTLVNAILFGSIFVAVQEINRRAKVLDALKL